MASLSTCDSLRVLAVKGHSFPPHGGHTSTGVQVKSLTKPVSWKLHAHVLQLSTRSICDRYSIPGRLLCRSTVKPNPSAFLRPRAITSATGELDVDDEDFEEEEDFDSEDAEDGGSVATLTRTDPAEVFVEPSSGSEASEEEGAGADGSLSVEYSVTMQSAMGNNSLVYRHEDGINYARVLPDLIVGSCPQSAEDIDIIRDKENVGTVLCLQQNSDLEWFGMDINEIIGRTVERGDIKHVRAEIRDFDPHSLRLELPMAVAKLHKANLERGTAYVHCTAGLGRAPAVALAYMWWLRDFNRLEDANEVLQAVRRCGPKLFAIRAALCDILTGSPREPVTVLWRNRGVMPQKVEVAGLDVGWHNKLELQRQPNSQWWSATRELPVGTYYYKFVVDGDKWTYSLDSPLTAPDRDNNINNYADVPGFSLGPEALALRKRLMEEGTPLEAEERAIVMDRLNKLAASL